MLGSVRAPCKSRRRARRTGTRCPRAGRAPPASRRGLGAGRGQWQQCVAIAAATLTSGTDRVLAAEQSIQFIAPAFEGPFEAKAQVLSATRDDVLCLVELRDTRGEEVRSMSTFRMRVLP